MRRTETEVSIEHLLGKVLTEVSSNSETVTLTVSPGTRYVMRHMQDCCESVYLDDVCGDLEDLVGKPIIRATAASNSEEPSMGAESHTWTFYHLSTIAGSVTLRWFGSSNGYYSERVSVILVEDPEEEGSGMQCDDCGYDPEDCECADGPTYR